MSAEPDALLEAARGYASHRRHVFPCVPDGKEPMVPHGLLEATTRLDKITTFWTKQHPTANIALRTGQESGFVVLDVDDRNGGLDSLHELEREHGPLPATRTVKTPHGGTHFYFRDPGVKIKTTTDTPRQGLDIRGDGGYILAPPSVVDGRPYVVDDALPLAPMPQWLIEATRDTDCNGYRPPTEPSVWVSMLRDGIPDGKRNTSLTRLTGYLLRRYVDVDVVAELIHLVKQNRCLTVDRRAPKPKPRAEVDQIIDSIASDEARRRRP